MVKSPKSLARRTPKATPLQLANRNQENVYLISDSEDEGSSSISSGSTPRKLTPKKNKSPIKENETSPATPPKQRKIHLNDENKTILTPSTLLRKLNLTSPLGEKKSSAKKLFKEKYQSARKALHSSAPAHMPGREKEIEELKGFLINCLEHSSAGTMYISGPPGTGKTAALSMIMEEQAINNAFNKVVVNCTSIKSCGCVYSKIVKELGLKANGKSEKECLAAIENYLTKSYKLILLVLDEIDQLEGRKQSVLYTIFEWPAQPNSKLVLIGIANALDLTDRILPRLQAHCQLKPKLMHFAPYSKQQIVQIFIERLKESDVLDIFSPSAIQMLAGKVAAVSGDIRRALDIGRRVVELAEQHKDKELLRPLENLTTIETDRSKIKPQTVELKDVISVLNNVYGTTQNLSEECDESFPLQQKIIVCTLLLILKQARNKDVTVGKLHEIYRKVCQKRNLLAVDQGEFAGLCSLVETRGILRVISNKEPRLRKVRLVWDEDEVMAALKDKQLLSSVLQDTNSLGKL